MGIKNKRYRYSGMVLPVLYLILSCQTLQSTQPAEDRKGTIVAENSRGYRADASDTLKIQPDWVKTGKIPSESRGKRYFQAKGEGPTITGASRAAENEVKRQIASYILAPMNLQAGTNSAGERIIVDPKKGAGGTTEKTAEQRYIESWVRSSASFSGAHKEEYFWERTETDNTESIRYWVKYSITEEETAAARVFIAGKNDIAKKEAEEFNTLRARLGIVLSDLDKLSFLEQEAPYKTCYEELLGINAQWQELTTQKERPEYTGKTPEIAAAVGYYDPTNSRKRIAHENERLKIERDILKNETKIREEAYQRGGDSPRAAGSGAPSKPSYSAFTVGSVRLQMTKAIKNGEFLFFLDGTDKPDLFSRNLTGEKPAVNVSWVEAVLYCNWLSNRAGLENYYAVKGKNVELTGVKNGYRLPSREEINAGLVRNVIKPEDLLYMGVLSSDPAKAYRFDPQAKGLKVVDSSFPTDNIGFMVVRNDN
ncbi:MAG: formylglycine-generating enzyme family protein [Treponema sp.]|nr:formylglycine-generating enzyme family protein [Treponema sp.]